MPSDPAAALGLLLRSATMQDHQDALDLATAALNSAAGDTTLRQTKVVALLKLDRFDDALRTISDGGDKAAKVCLFELAYALYKTGKLQDAEEILKAGQSPASRKIRHLSAQVAYRGERFDEALKIYRKLGEETDEGTTEENDLSINMVASQAQVEWQGITGSGYLQGQADTFELAYNSACACAARGDYFFAAMLLQRAASLLEASDDLSEDEKKAEMVPITLQRAIILARLRRTEEAMKLLASLPFSSSTDAGTISLAKANQALLAAKGTNPHLVQRTANLGVSSPDENSLFEFQNALQCRNKHIVDLEAKKFRGVVSRTSQTLESSKLSIVSPGLANIAAIRAAALCEGQTGRAALRPILALLEKRPDDVGALLTAIQLHVEARNISAATSLLEAFSMRTEGARDASATDTRFSPGLVALAVALYKEQGRVSSASAELRQAAQYWTKKGDGNGRAGALLREAGTCLLKSPNAIDVDTAGASFEALNKQGGSIEPVAVAGLVAAFAIADEGKVADRLSGLPSVVSLTAGVDVSALLQGGLAKVVVEGSERRKRAREEDRADAKTNKKRRRKLPKDYDEGKKMDPERWLPLRDRSSYRPKGKKGKKKANEATQGGVVKDEEMLALVGGAGTVKVEKATTSGPPSKKKKKGKR